jgi:mediator of RNA polymerase II transcription subunit 24
MQTDFHPAGNPKIRAVMQTQNLVSQAPLEEQFNDVWKSVLEQAWLPLDSAQTLCSLLHACGPFWLVNKLVNRIFHCKYVQVMQYHFGDWYNVLPFPCVLFFQEMTRTMDIVFAIMHLNIEKCTISLLSEMIPMLLLNKMQ